MAMAGKHPQKHKKMLFQTRLFGSLSVFQSMMMLRGCAGSDAFISVGGVHAQKLCSVGGLGNDWNTNAGETSLI
jgi:hypothetical protein